MEQQDTTPKPSAVDQRRHARLAIRLPYRLAVAGNEYTGMTGNVSLGGVYLETLSRPIPDDCLSATGRITLLQDDAEILAAACRVVYIGGGIVPYPDGVGIAFEDVAEPGLNRLRGLLIASIR